MEETNDPAVGSGVGADNTTDSGSEERSTRAGLSEAEREALWNALHSGPTRSAYETVERILAARVAAAEHARAEVVAKVRAALVMSDHEPTNRVWHEQMQRVRAALSDAAAPEADSRAHADEQAIL